MAEKPTVQDLSAAELRKLAASKDWGEFCAARISRQQNRIKNLNRKIALRQNALKEAQEMLVAAQADLEKGPPVGWELPKSKQGGYNVNVPAANLVSKGN